MQKLNKLSRVKINDHAEKTNFDAENKTFELKINDHTENQKLALHFDNNKRFHCISVYHVNTQYHIE